MKVIGLTGGIGSGKSTFCNLMANHGIASIDTDQIARDLVKPGTPGLAQVVATFGEQILNFDGTLNRKALRETIFADPKDSTGRLKLESILHPLIQAETRRQIQQFQHNQDYQADWLLVAIPLLVEGILKTGNKPEYIDEIWVLDCSQETQIERASQRDGANINQIKNIISNQVPREERLRFADRIIDNDSDLNELHQQIMHLLAI